MSRPNFIAQAMAVNAKRKIDPDAGLEIIAAALERAYEQGAADKVKQSSGKGGATTSARYGKDHYSSIGAKGGHTAGKNRRRDLRHDAATKTQPAQGKGEG